VIPETQTLVVGIKILPSVGYNGLGISHALATAQDFTNYHHNYFRIDTHEQRP